MDCRVALWFRVTGRGEDEAAEIGEPPTASATHCPTVTPVDAIGSVDKRRDTVRSIHSHNQSGVSSLGWPDSLDLVLQLIHKAA